MIQTKSRRQVVPRTVRVAIYCRQSVEDARSEFGSIEAQREAVAAYVTSQRGEGWVALPEHYDDGGYSGATTQRPAFQRLLRDVDAGLVDVIAVYKLDRLSRSLSDFVTLMERFRKHGVEFVSVTQQFTTTSSVGRMTLNLLATFAEFEREQISERTRDKMLAARRRGMWTGGPVPLGFDLRDKKLVVNAEEAEQVRWLYAAFQRLGSVTRTLEAANARGLRMKSWVGRDGRQVRGAAFTKSTMLHLLTNPLYVGMQSAGEDLVACQHEAIVTHNQADAVRALLRANKRDGGAKVRNRHGVLLRGLLTCATCGSSMNHTWSGRWHYYACSKVLKQGASACPGSRVARDEIESAVIERIRLIGKDPELVDATIAAARREREAKIPELIGNVRRLKLELGPLENERASLIEAVSLGGAAVPTLMNRIAEIDEKIAVHDALIQDAQAELALAQVATIDEEEVRRTLAQFDDVWDALFVRERERILDLLIRGITFDGRTREIEVTFA